MSDMIEIGGLWKNENKRDGSTYLSGSLGSARLLVFVNKYKKGKEDKAPDFKVYLAPKERRDDRGNRDTGRSEETTPTESDQPPF